ncbi:MAG: tetratricopeptide repeat protein [Proteobacteria bacterium]|nr:tetratricopeptide repeat protein [Pseudomonadota bacterium]
MTAEAGVPRARRRARALLAAALVAGTVAAYAPALGAGFVWDDDDYVTENPLLHEPDGLRRIWLSADAPSQYFPLTYTTFRIEYALWELEPLGYHLVNVLLHAANALLLWWVLVRLGLPAAWLAAAIFALHPVQVESVAWITERKNVLSLFLSLGSLLAWLRFTEPGARRPGPAYGTSLALAALALTAKTTACTLPAAQVLVLWARGRAVDARRWLQIAPFLLLGLAMGGVSLLWERTHQGTVGERFALAPLESLLVATRAVWFYLGKLVWPVDLTFSYPKFSVDPSDPLQYGWLVAGAILVLGLWAARGRIGRWPLAAAVFFVATLSPVLGFVPLFTFFYSHVADHYQYVACIGPIALAAGVGATLLERSGRAPWRARYVLAGVLLVALGGLTYQQSRIYESRETLWRDTVAKHPASWMGHTNLGRELMRQRRFEEATASYRAALEVRPDLHGPHRGLALASLRLGRQDDALAHLGRALELKPDFYAAHKDMAHLRARRGELPEAFAHYREMVAIAPNNPEGFFLMGRALEKRSRLQEARNQYRRVLQIDPDHKGARRALTILQAHGD